MCPVSPMQVKVLGSRNRIDRLRQCTESRHQGGRGFGFVQPTSGPCFTACRGRIAEDLFEVDYFSPGDVTIEPDLHTSITKRRSDWLSALLPVKASRRRLEARPHGLS